MRVRTSWRVALAAAVLASACNDSGPTAPADPSLSTGGPSLAVPTELAVLALSPSEVRLTWRDNATNEDGYEVLRSTTGPTGAFSRAALLGMNSWMFVDFSRAPATQYCYAVRAYRGTPTRVRVASALTAAVCATTAAAGAPRTPTYLNATPQGSTRIHVAWTNEEGSETGYRLERSLDGGVTWVLAAMTTPEPAFVDEGRAPEQRVCYRVFALADAVPSVPSPTDCTAPPAAPTNLTATLESGGTIALAWTDNSGVEDIYLIRRSYAGLYVETVGSVPANTTSFRDAPPTDAPGYMYTVVPVSDDGLGSPSNEATVWMSGGPPVAPTDLVTAQSQYPGNVLLRWTDNTANETGFRAERAPAEGGPWSELGTVSADVVQMHIVHPLGTRRCYRVRALVGALVSEPSNVVCAALPAVPSGVTATALASGTAVDVTWQHGMTFVTGFDVERRDAFTWESPVLFAVAGGSTSYRDATVSPNIRYSYRVRARSADGVSNFSESVAVTTSTTPPPTPGAPTVTPLGSSPPDIQVHWLVDQANVDRYRLERSVDRGATWETAAIAYGYFEDRSPAVEFEREQCYRVIAINALGESAPSAPACTAYPVPPTVNWLMLDAENRIDVGWTDNSNVEEGYEVREYYYDESGWSQYYILATLPPNATRWIGAGGSLGDIRVVAVRNGGPFY